MAKQPRKPKRSDKPPGKPPPLSYLAAYEQLQNLDALSDDVIVPENVSRAMRGGVSRWTDWRHRPPLRRIPINARSYGHRLGDLRALIRGEKPAA